jgi:glucose-1-phosphate cytidylyltransferase
MKVVILAGGLGTRLAEETVVRPKPMVEIGGRPILWHIMQMYACHGITDFIVCLGYRGYMIKEYFANYFLHSSDVTIDLTKNSIEVHQSQSMPWRITLVDTGDTTQTGGRLRRIAPYLGNETFCMTYGDGLSDHDISATIRFHMDHGCLATVTAIQPPGRWGLLNSEGDSVTGFLEKPRGDGGWINGGFFVLSPRVLERISDDSTVWEREPMISLAAEGELKCFRHNGFWQAMDTLRDKALLDELWRDGSAPWKKWQ